MKSVTESTITVTDRLTKSAPSAATEFVPDCPPKMGSAAGPIAPASVRIVSRVTVATESAVGGKVQKPALWIAALEGTPGLVQTSSRSYSGVLRVDMPSPSASRRIPGRIKHKDHPFAPTL